MKFAQAQAYLDSLQQHKIKLGLDAMERFLDKVARPDKQLRFVHVAGTNGKGSVSVNIMTVLAQAGYRVGLFTSPHLSSVRERFRINDEFISEEQFARHAGRVRQALGAEMITYFEFTTALALLWFVEEQVDLVVLETGLGGRLDATNVVTPLVSIITNVSMDHEAYLGNDLASVAFEKAGIIKTAVPLITGVADDESREVIAARCRELDTPMYLYGREFVAEEEGGDVGWCWRADHDTPFKGMEIGGLRCGMKGDYQRQNSSLAIAAIMLLKKEGFDVGEEEIRQGLPLVHWPGRLEYITLPRQRRLGNGAGDGELRYIIDGAHNPAGVESLVRTLKREYSYDKLIVLWGAMEDKDLSLTLAVVGELASTIVLTQPQGERAATPEHLYKVLSPTEQEKAHLKKDVSEALRFAEELASGDDLILIAGSLYLIGDIRCRLVGGMVD